MFLEGAAKDGFSVPPSPGGDPRRSPHPLATFLQRLHIANPPPSIRRGYIYLSGWRDTPFTPVYQRLSRDAAWKTFSLPVGHNIMSEAFDQLLEIALQFA